MFNASLSPTKIHWAMFASQRINKCPFLEVGDLPKSLCCHFNLSHFQLICPKSRYLSQNPVFRWTGFWLRVFEISRKNDCDLSPTPFTTMCAVSHEYIQLMHLLPCTFGWFCLVIWKQQTRGIFRKKTQIQISHKSERARSNHNERELKAQVANMLDLKKGKGLQKMELV